MKRVCIQLFRVTAALLAFTAIFVQLNRHLSYGFNTVNFFSYFTNLSNIIFAVVLLTSGIICLLGQKHSPLVAHGGATEYPEALTNVVLAA